MRSSPTFSDRRFSLSFFLTTPAKKPRTECCCQPVAFMMAAIVVPLASWSIFRTAACLEDERATFFGVAAFASKAPGPDLKWPRGLFLAVCFAARDDLRDVFADFDFDLLVAIWLSSGSAT